jgi:hypothetical protein
VLGRYRLMESKAQAAIADDLAVLRTAIDISS